jgi:predicted DNA-binding transcriptional regulator AlpA
MSKVWLRFAQLQQRGIVKSWPQLKRLQEKYGFPKGRMISPNVRAWPEDEVDEYLASRPVEGPEPKGAAKQHRDRRRKGATDNTSEATA